MLIKYIKSVLWRVAKRLSYIEEARCLKVNCKQKSVVPQTVTLGPNKQEKKSVLLYIRYI